MIRANERKNYDFRKVVENVSKDEAWVKKLKLLSVFEESTIVVVEWALKPAKPVFLKITYM